MSGFGSIDRALKSSRGVNCAAAGAGLLSLAYMVHVALSTRTSGDYVPRGVVTGDNAAPAVRALSHLDISAYISHQPAIGLTSLILRAPLLAVVRALGGHYPVGYQLGSVACMIPLIALSCWMIANLLRRSELSARKASAIGVVAAALLILSPVNREALLAGHPEEILTGGLAVAAVLAARNGRSSWAALLLGLAIGSKAWGVMALPPVLLALPGSRRQVVVITGAIVTVLVVAPVAADLSAFRHALHYEGVQHLVNPLSIWWPVSKPFPNFHGIALSVRTMPFGLSRSSASLVGMLAILPPVGWLWIRQMRTNTRVDPLALLALLGVLRILCDSTHLEYYYEAALVPLTVWEAVAASRLPLLSVCAMAAVAAIPGFDAQIPPVLLNILSTGLTAVLGLYLARCAFHPVVVAAMPGKLGAARPADLGLQLLPTRRLAQ